MDNSAQDNGDRIIYNGQTGALLFDADGSRGGDAVFISSIGQNLEITASNIQIIGLGDTVFHVTFL